MHTMDRSRLDRRTFLKTSALSVVASALPYSGALAAPKKGGHFRMGKAHGQTTDTLDPGTAENYFMNALLHGIHGRLTEVAPDGTLKPEVAESWEASPDATEYRFKLRRGLTFHDGKDVTVEDVVASINYHRGEESTSAAGPIVAPILDIFVEGDDTVVFKLKGGNADFPFTLSDFHLPICPSTDGMIDWRSGIGCGSYVLKEFNPGVVAKFERNPNHWNKDVAWFDSIEMITLLDQNARTTALVAGDVDAIDRVDLKAAALMARRPNLRIQSVPGNQHYVFAMRTNTDPFTDNHVRMALKYAVDREELVEKILFGYGSIGNDHPIGAGQRYFNEELQQRRFDPDKARWHLKQAGIENLKVSLSGSEAAFVNCVDAITLYQNSAKSCGIDLSPNREPKDGYWSDVWMKKPFTSVYWAGRPVEDQMFTTVYSCGASWNDTVWCNERFQELLVSARSELDEEKRRSMYWEMQEIVSNDGGAVIPMFANYVFAMNDTVGHGEFGSNWDVDGERWMERWWFQ